MSGMVLDPWVKNVFKTVFPHKFKRKDSYAFEDAIFWILVTPYVFEMNYGVYVAFVFFDVIEKINRIVVLLL